ncbi:MAG TPA: plastocyanin/azurin family copper-binding protein [Gemmatimonadales bacterium]|nr:plastocyanin/azurin family copper-binding protein [Gemmatimonadales bacterium]
MRFGVMAAVVLVAATHVACSDPAASSNKTKATQITVGDNYFNPTDVTIAPGDTVIWIWGGAVGHNVVFTSAPATPPSDCGVISSGVCIRAFGTATGTFTYACTLHGGMVGSVTVH